MEPIVKNIMDTALWVAVYRAEESERPDAVFKDPFAGRLAGERGREIASVIRFGRDNSWSFVARTFNFDEFIQYHVNDGVDTVLNLAAGLDARPYRMQLPASLNWIEVDFPEMIAYKESMLANEKPVCKLERVALDLADRPRRQDFFKQVSSKAKRVLVVSEGLIIYLDEEQAAALADDLSAQQNFRNWVFDLQSPMLLEMAQKEMGVHLDPNKAVFKFGPEEGEDFFLKYGWKSLESRSKLKTGAKLNRLPEELLQYAGMPEQPGPVRPFPWSGDCLFENIKS